MPHAQDPIPQHHPAADMAQMVKEKVASGDYATESEVVREGLRALRAQDSALEQWLRTEGVATHCGISAPGNYFVRSQPCTTSTPHSWHLLRGQKL
jgi:hypothetical protein